MHFLNKTDAGWQESDRMNDNPPRWILHYLANQTSYLFYIADRISAADVREGFKIKLIIFVKFSEKDTPFAEND